MKSKGFTMVELLGVIIILAVVATIVTPTISIIIRNTGRNAYNQQIENIRSAAKNWASDNLFATPKEGEPALILSMNNDLVKNGYIDKNIVDPNTGEPFGNIEIYVIYDAGSLIYDIYENGNLISEDTNRLDDMPRLYLKGDAVIYVSLNATYTDSGVDATDSEGNTLSYVKKIMKGDAEVASIDTSKAGTYVIVYTATIGNLSNSVARTIIIK